MDCSPSGSSVHEIFQASILERVAISYPGGSSWPSDWTCVFWVSCTGFFHHWATWESQKCVIVQSLSCVWLFVTLRTTAHKAPLSSTISQSFSDSCPLSQWCYLTILSSAPRPPPLPSPFAFNLFQHQGQDPQRADLREKTLMLGKTEVRTVFFKWMSKTYWWVAKLIESKWVFFQMK